MFRNSECAEVVGLSTVKNRESSLLLTISGSLKEDNISSLLVVSDWIFPLPRTELGSLTKPIHSRAGGFEPNEIP
jgi:hypothetical protein